MEETYSEKKVNIIGRRGREHTGLWKQLTEAL